MADTVTIDDVRHVARLARLGLTEAQARAIARDLNAILGHMEVLSRIDTSGVPEYVAAEVGAAMRRDHEAGPRASRATPPETFAPEMRDGLFLVPRLDTHGTVDA